MKQELIISISGLRGLVGENFFPETAALYGAAFGTFLNEQWGRAVGKPVVALGRDSRISGAMFAAAAASGLCSAGADVIDLGICSTPAAGLMVRHLGCQGGAVITASHNPIEYNGIKLLLDNGIAPPKPLAEQIRQRFVEKKVRYVDAVRCGIISSNTQTVQVHVDKVLSIVNPDQIRRRKYNVVLDSINGAGGPEAQKLLEELGCRIVGINLEPSGRFAHKPEPTQENLTDLCEKVRQTGADLGFAQDPDADRLAIVDEQGTYIGEEYTLAFAALLRFSEQPGGKAAANLSTSRMIDDIAARFGGTVLRTPVGEAHVANTMLEHQCIIGGEGNGGVIDLRIGPIRDSLVAMALTLQLMAQTGKSVRQLTQEIGRYEMVKLKYAANAKQAQALIQAACSAFPQAKTDTRDGCRLDLPDGWLHIRTSNTEPIVRIIFETRTAEASADLGRKIESICQKVLKR
ncbi:MAG TPA: phosphoglucosamine mutase [Anaerohalosphaeraceae bacterium]|nr:phosphoglucosamine mutase [Anaerohalosphaeraceae bacterium]